MEKVDAVHWRKSARCSSNACVEVADVAGTYMIRDSKDPGGAVLRFSTEEWAAFVDGVKAGDIR
jgi:hypothetical protein